MSSNLAQVKSCVCVCVLLIFCIGPSLSACPSLFLLFLSLDLLLLFVPSPSPLFPSLSTVRLSLFIFLSPYPQSFHVSLCLNLLLNPNTMLLRMWKSLPPLAWVHEEPRELKMPLLCKDLKAVLFMSSAGDRSIIFILLFKQEGCKQTKEIDKLPAKTLLSTNTMSQFVVSKKKKKSTTWYRTLFF